MGLYIAVLKRGIQKAKSAKSLSFEQTSPYPHDLPPFYWKMHLSWTKEIFHLVPDQNLLVLLAPQGAPGGVMF